jgi:alginate production protein
LGAGRIALAFGRVVIVPAALAVFPILVATVGPAAAADDAVKATNVEVGNMEAASMETAQFQLPQSPPSGGEEAAPMAVPELPQRLNYEYGYGSESEATYLYNADLDRKLDDDLGTLQPQINGYITYRPTDWLEGTAELVMEREMRVHGPRNVTLPNGDLERRPGDRSSLLIDQAFITLHQVTDPFSFSVGRRNYEDARHWLYDTSLDIGAIGFRDGRLRAEATYGREVLYDLDVLHEQQTDRIDTFMLFGEYRAFEDISMAGYLVRRHDRSGQDGRWDVAGLRSVGFPSESFNYWVDIAGVWGRDENDERIRGYGFDAGATYRFAGVPLNPNVTLAYAFGSGDDDPDDGVNGAFRQTGLQSNEQKFAGLADFKYYGEALDPELSNLHILTLGLGFRPIGDLSVDFIYHHYRLDAHAEELRNSQLTAEMNQDPGQNSHNVGSALDVVVGIRNVFGLKRFGVDLRGGVFFPGDAFRNERGGGDFVDADSAAAVAFKFWL